MHKETNNKRIIKNTFVLYLRMILILAVGLYTSRVVLNTLGVEDYGIYNVVGGFVTFFTFLNGAMSTATQRFITFEQARGNLTQQRETFSTAIVVHFLLALLIFGLAETIGLWFVCTQLIIPEERFSAALWVYQLSVASMVMTIISVPYNALIISHEKMSAFAYISIFDAMMKLIIVYFLTVVTWDKLIFYAVLLCMISILDRIIYGIYCNRNFIESKIQLKFNRKIVKNMTDIAGWSLMGNIAGIFCTQGINVLLNMFFGPAVNAARGIATTVQGVVSGFVNNFQLALNPQITKSYAGGDLERMHTLIFASSKFSFFLLLVLVLPLMMETEYILSVWLHLVPDHAVWFVRLILGIMLIESLANSMMIASQAVGKVKLYQCVVGGILLLVLPISYLILKAGFNPEAVFIVYMGIALLAQLFRVIIVGQLIKLSIVCYLKKVFIPIIFVFISSIILSLSIYTFIDSKLTFLNCFIVVMFTTLVSLGSIIFLGLSRTERTYAVKSVKSLIQRKLVK